MYIVMTPCPRPSTPIAIAKVHPCAGKPEGEPTHHYVRAAQDVLVRNLEQYEAAGNELQGRNVTLDRAYTSYEVVRR